MAGKIAIKNLKCIIEIATDESQRLPQMVMKSTALGSEGVVYCFMFESTSYG